MMNNLTKSNMQKIRFALDKNGIHYFSSPQQALFYTSCKAQLEYRTLHPTSIKVSLTPSETGILFEASIPIAIQAIDRQTNVLICSHLANENFGMAKGGLVYNPKIEQMQYRIFCSLDKNAFGFDEEEVMSCIRQCVWGCTSGFEKVMNALDEAQQKEAQMNDENDFSDLDSLFERMFASWDEKRETDLAGNAKLSEGTEDLSTEEETSTTKDVKTFSFRGKPNSYLNDKEDTDGDSTLNETKTSEALSLQEELERFLNNNEESD